MNKSIPKSNRNEGPHNRSNRPMWMNDTALVKVKSKNEAYKCYGNTMDVKDYEINMLRLVTKHAGSVVRHIEYIRKPLEELKITEEKLKERLESLNPHKSPGPDGLHPQVLKELSNEISKPLAIIMQKSLDEHTPPQKWKDAHVSPIFKKGSKSSMTNYRPVSLTSVICKQMEAIIKDHLIYLYLYRRVCVCVCVCVCILPSVYTSPSVVRSGPNLAHTCRFT